MTNAENEWFERLAETADLQDDSKVSTCLKSRIYSRMIVEMEKEGPLAPLSETLESGRGLCVFERLMAIAPGAATQEFQYCKVCHARVLGERVEKAPIFWPCCPYSDFQGR